VGDAGAAQRVDLVVGILVSSRDAGIAEQHGVENSDSTEVCRRSFSTRLLDARRSAVAGGRSGSRGVSANESFSTVGSASAGHPQW
jgi:hypothetical protein